MKNLQVIVLLCLAAVFALFASSMNYYYFGRAQDYYNLRKQEAFFGKIDNTCLINASITERKLIAQGIPAKILIFHCSNGKTSFSHSVAMYENKGYLLIFDNDGSSVISPLSKYNLKSSPKDIISVRYNFVSAATWFEPPM